MENGEQYDDDADLQEAATYLEYLAVKSDLNAVERHVVLGVTHALKEHMVRVQGKDNRDKEYQDGGTGTNRRFSPKELLSEAERVLIRAASGMSLLERLRRDSQLRVDIKELMDDLAKNSTE